MAAQSVSYHENCFQNETTSLEWFMERIFRMIYCTAKKSIHKQMKKNNVLQS